jgi:hypothetical protein
MFKQYLCNSSISSPIANDLFHSWAHATRDPGNPQRYAKAKVNQLQLNPETSRNCWVLWVLCWVWQPWGWGQCLGNPVLDLQPDLSSSTDPFCTRFSLLSPSSPAASGGLPRANSHSGARGPWLHTARCIPRPSTIRCTRIILNTVVNEYSLSLTFT